MKKIAVILSSILIFTLCACSKGNPPFKATVIETRGSVLLVAPNEDEDIYKTADRVYVTVPDNTDISEFKTGDKIKITYNGKVAESYPAHIAEVSVIERISE